MSTSVDPLISACSPGIEFLRVVRVMRVKDFSYPSSRFQRLLDSLKPVRGYCLQHSLELVDYLVDFGSQHLLDVRALKDPARKPHQFVWDRMGEFRHGSKIIIHRLGVSVLGRPMEA
jgi:hypothetical protein